MKLKDLENKRIGILGFGQEGQAVLTYLKKHGLIAEVFENNEFDGVENCDVLFRSPGIWRNHEKILAAEKEGAIITSQTKFFFENTPAKIIGITGTKGKGTTSSLIYQTLQEAGKKVYLTGNIGKVQPLEFLDNTTVDNIVVFEMSSFQLQDLTISPHIGVCLMVTSDHLNHHTDLAEYHAAKAAITSFQDESDTAIYNADYPATVKIGEQGSGKKLTVSTHLKPESGALISGDLIILEDGTTIDCSDRNLRGAHNLENIAAAALASRAVGINVETIQKVSKEFSGLEHRLQFAGTFDGVSYYNDSISTVPETTIAAMNAFSEPIHLLLGGSEKGLDYTNLISEIANKQNLSSITLLGEVGEKLKNQIADATKTPLFGPYHNFAEAIANIKSKAQSGEVVLLSPAAASFDMFENYADRGHQFVKLISTN